MTGCNYAALIAWIVGELSQASLDNIPEFAEYLGVPVVQPRAYADTDLWWSTAGMEDLGTPVGLAWNPMLLNVEVHFQDKTVRIKATQIQHPEMRVKVFEWIVNLRRERA